MKNFKSQLRTRGGAAIASAGGRVFVAAAGTSKKETLYSPATGLAIANPMVLTNGAFNFDVADSVQSVDLYIQSPTGHFVVLKGVKPSGDATISVDTGRPEAIMVIPYHYLDQAGNATETPCGFTLPGAVQPNPLLQVVDIDSGITIDVGTLSTDSGDADGFIDGVSVATAGLRKASMANASPRTLGVLLQVQDSANAGDSVPEQDITMIGKQITYTLGSGADTATGFIMLPVSLPPTTL